MFVCGYTTMYEYSWGRGAPGWAMEVHILKVLLLHLCYQKDRKSWDSHDQVSCFPPTLTWTSLLLWLYVALLLVKALFLLSFPDLSWSWTSTPVEIGVRSPVGNKSLPVFFWGIRLFPVVWGGPLYLLAVTSLYVWKVFFPVCQFLTLHMEPFVLQVFYVLQSTNTSFMVPRFGVLCLSYHRFIKVFTFIFMQYFQSFKKYNW